MTKTSAASPATVAFFVQAALSFGLALVAVVVGIWYLPVDGWVRGFLALGMLFLTTSAFTLAKCIRDRQDENSVVSRVDQARVDKLLSEHDPFKAPAL
ncbi:YiaA/YiaB family inner membrane protein [Amycolatopsis decaplanina]|uniref:YiaAB two helix domain-containing protein n=1 Tax=Amycolatopsis decaplanina DSM 44594 TaxID=1284240 RepID=M2ZHY8_9PSEU|nr:YiaA/YiaB family inner membrane protein [Amycolatopsis decaplanina]EME59954.1 YiaAB two helix domain-containing protein [Amycolatopsis decaplanina DSM 44594]